MNDEKELRLRIIKFLEEHLGPENVEDVQGSGEHGIDIVFNKNDVFGKKRKYGIQVKAEDINATIAQKILGQLCVAFGHKFSLKPEEFLDAVYVVTNGQIIQTAINYVSSANVGFRNVFWIPGNELLPLLKKFEDGKMKYEKE